MKRTISPSEICPTCGTHMTKDMVEITCDHCNTILYNGENNINFIEGQTLWTSDEEYEIDTHHFCDWECEFEWIIENKDELKGFFVNSGVPGRDIESWLTGMKNALLRQMNIQSVDIIWEDDEGAEILERFAIGNTKELGSIVCSQLTIIDIKVRDD